jgi:pimeloyl-ACP methyl ester carboxylesterase
MSAFTAHTRTVRLRNGLDIQYRETGYSAGIPLILLHGVTDSLHAWKPFTDALPRAVRAFAISQRGHGESSKPEEGYGAAAFAGDLAAFMDALGLQRAHICGHSMGTWVAQHFAQDYPERVESLILIDGFVSLAGNPAVRDLVDELNRMGPHIDRSFARAFQESTVETPMTPSYLELVVGESMKVPARIWRAAFAAMIAEWADVSSISCPVLLMAGEKDALFTDADRRALAASFNAPREVTYPGLGHAPHWEQPMRVAHDIARFVTEVASRRPSLRPARAG